MEPHWTSIGMFWATLVVGTVTIFAALVNYFIFRSQVDGNVIVYAKHDTKRSTIITLTIENIGKGVAYDVGFTSSRPIPDDAFGWEPIPQEKSKYMSDGPFINGIPALEPGGKRELDWGQFIGLKSALGGKPITIKATYRSAGDLFQTDSMKTTDSVIDIMSFEGTVAYDDNWEKKISEDIRKIREAMDPVLRGNRRLRVSIEDEKNTE